jgi:hypothetical protein
MANSLIDVGGLQRSGVLAAGHEPSIRTLRAWTKLRKIPHYRLGHFVFYDPLEVAAHIRTRLRVPARGEDPKEKATRPTSRLSAPNSDAAADRETPASAPPPDQLPADVRFRRPREPRFRISKYHNPTGSVAFRVSGWLRTTRIRRNFKTHQEAAAEVEALTISATQANAEVRTAVTRLTSPQLTETETAYQLLKGRPRSLLFYLNYALERFREPHEGIKLAAAVEEYLAARRHEHDRREISTPHLRNLKRVLLTFGRHFPNLALAELDGPRVLEFLERAHHSAKTFNNRRGIISSFLKFCLQHGRVESNPLTRIPARRVRRKKGRASTFSANQTREFMHALETISDGRLVPYYALAFFAGIRPGVPFGEMSRLTSDAVKLDDGVIDITAEVSKIGEPRRITIQPNLGAWLRAYPLRCFAIVPGNFQKRRARLGEQFDLSHDVARHTFISMFVAKFRSMGEAALQSGNSESIIRRHYLDLKSAAEAEDYFTILPQRNASAT